MAIRYIRACSKLCRQCYFFSEKKKTAEREKMAEHEKGGIQSLCTKSVRVLSNTTTECLNQP